MTPDPLEEVIGEYFPRQQRDNSPRMADLPIRTNTRPDVLQVPHPNLDFITRDLGQVLARFQNSRHPEGLVNLQSNSFTNYLKNKFTPLINFSENIIDCISDNFKGIAVTSSMIGMLSLGVYGINALPSSINLKQVYSYVMQSTKSNYEKIFSSNDTLSYEPEKGVSKDIGLIFPAKETKPLPDYEYLNQKRELSSLISKIDSSIAEMRQYTKPPIDYSYIVSEAREYFNEMDSYRERLDEDNFDKLSNSERYPLTDAGSKIEKHTESIKGYLRGIKVLCENRISELERKSSHWFTRKSKKSKYELDIEEKQEIIYEINRLILE